MTMHHCLYITEILKIIFEFVKDVGYDHWMSHLHARKSLYSLAITCRSFSSPALDALWRDLHSLDPLLNAFPDVARSVDDAQWQTFHKYAIRVTTIDLSHGTNLSPTALQQFLLSVEHCPGSYLPLLPNVTQLKWGPHLFKRAGDFDTLLVKYFVGASVTKFELTLASWECYSSSELTALTDLPKFIPSVTSATILLDPQARTDLTVESYPVEMGKLVSQWKKLQILQACAIPQPLLDAWLARGTFGTLHIDFRATSPLYPGRIPSTIRHLSLSMQGPQYTHFLAGIRASPITFSLTLYTESGRYHREPRQIDVVNIIHLLPSCLDPSHLLSLSIQPISSMIPSRSYQHLVLRDSSLSSLVQFMTLQELDLDFFSAAHMTNADYARLAQSLTGLRSLKIGCEDPSLLWPSPAVSIEAVIAVLNYCECLETLHLVFNATVPPPGTSVMEDGTPKLSEDVVRQGWGISNRHMTKLGVGHSPIDDANVHVLATCLKSIMPCLGRIEYRQPMVKYLCVEETGEVLALECECKHELSEWKNVENILCLR